jgi:hypothetical protein
MIDCLVAVNGWVIKSRIRRIRNVPAILSLEIGRTWLKDYYQSPNNQLFYSN